MLYTKLLYNLIRYLPINPSLRHSCLINKKKIWRTRCFTKLSYSTKYKCGRSKRGILLLFTRSSRAHKKRLRLINNLYINYGISSLLYRIEYDPFRSSFISLNVYQNGLVCYKLHTNGVLPGSTLYSFFLFSNNLSNGNSFFLKNIPEGSIIHSVEQHPFYGSQYSRSAGTYCTMIRKYFSSHKCLIKLKSGSFKILPMNCKATIGIASNLEYRYIKYGKAGRSR